MLFRIKVYAAALAAFTAALVAVYFKGRKEAKADLRAELDQARLDAVLKANEVQDEIDEWDDLHLRDVAKSKWVRDNRK